MEAIAGGSDIEPSLPADHVDVLEQLNNLHDRSNSENHDAAHLARIAAAGPVVIGRDLAVEHTHWIDAVQRNLRLLGTFDLRPTIALVAEDDLLSLAAKKALIHSGRRFVHLPLEQSQARRWARLAESGADLVLTQRWLVDRLSWPDGVRVVALPEDLDGSEVSPTSSPDVKPQARLTPVPNVWGGFAALHDLLRTSSADRLAATAPFSATVSLFETLGGLDRGATIVLTRRRGRDPVDWPWLVEFGQPSILSISVADAVELLSLERSLFDELKSQLRALVLSPGLISVRLGRELRERLPDCSLFTATIEPKSGGLVAFGQIEDIDEQLRFLPAGAPPPGQPVAIVDDRGDPAPLWVPGRVVSLDDDNGAVSSRTGLLGRIVPGPMLEVVGTVDHLINVHGQSLNGAEALASLLREEDVGNAALVRSASGDSTTAFVVPRGEHPPSSNDLLARLRSKVSPYLLPSAIIAVDQLPFDQNGWADLDRLQSDHPDSNLAGTPDNLRSAQHGESDNERSAGDATSHLELVDELAREVLYLDRIDPDINLFDMGATSVDLVRLATRLEQQLDLSLDVESVLAFPSLRRMAESLHVIVDSTNDEVNRPSGRTPISPAARQEIILDPEDREAFRRRRVQIRPDLVDRPVTYQLPEPVPTLQVRRSARTFGHSVIDSEAFSAFLGSLTTWADSDGERRAAYPSAGGLYPVRTYVQIEQGRIRDFGCGLYYLEPDRNGLILIDEQPPIDALSHNWINRDVFRSSSFSIFFIAHLPAIEPLYGAESIDYALIEAGAMVQNLQSAAPTAGLATTPIAAIDPDLLRERLQLGVGDVVLHSLVGGPEGQDAST